MLRVAEHFHHSDTGRARPVNEDAVFARPPLFAVADGMGGAQAGEVASNAALRLFQRGLPDGDSPAEARLAALVADANASVHELSQADAQRAGMGTTLTAAFLDEGELAIAHVGDSRLYRFRDGVLEQRTEDHSLVGELVRRGELSPEAAEEHPQRSIITRALGPESTVEVDHATFPVRAGDVFLLCSDGLTAMVPDAEIAEILDSSRSLAKAGKALIKAANAAGGRDNISVVLFRAADAGRRFGHADQATGVIDAQELRAARELEEQGGPVVRRVPRPATGRSSRRWRVPGPIKALLATVAVLVLIGTAAVIAVRSVYFVGASDDGFVTVYRGMPYELIGGVSAYEKQYESGVPVSALPPRLRQTIADHELRSHDDATDLVRQLEQGRVAGQR